MSVTSTPHEVSDPNHRCGRDTYVPILKGQPGIQELCKHRPFRPILREAGEPHGDVLAS